MEPTLTAVIAGNIRARLAWSGTRHQDFGAAMGWSKHTCHNKLNGLSALTIDEVERAARTLELEGPAVLFAAPGGFTAAPMVPTRSRCIEGARGQTLLIAA